MLIFDSLLAFWFKLNRCVYNVYAHWLLALNPNSKDYANKMFFMIHLLLLLLLLAVVVTFAPVKTWWNVNHRKFDHLRFLNRGRRIPVLLSQLDLFLQTVRHLIEISVRQTAVWALDERENKQIWAGRAVGKGACRHRLLDHLRNRCGAFSPLPPSLSACLPKLTMPIFSISIHFFHLSPFSQCVSNHCCICQAKLKVFIPLAESTSLTIPSQCKQGILKINMHWAFGK